MGRRLVLGDITIDVVLKDIKNVHLSVNPPTGRVRIAAPLRTSQDAIRLFAISKLSWIRKQQRKLRDQEREAPREYVDRESHYLWGKRYLLKVVEVEAAPSVELRHSRVMLRIRPGTDEDGRRTIMELWYREQLKAAVPPLVSKWEQLMRVRVERFFVQRMKTKWGSCSPATRSIRLNTDLAKKPRECLEYLVVHEMVHLLEPTHNERFVSLMERFYPRWRFHRERLNELPVRHEEWVY